MRRPRRTPKGTPPIPAGPICVLSGKNCLAKGEAKRTAKRQAKRASGNLQAYECRACGKWHVGNKRRFAA